MNTTHQTFHGSIPLITDSYGHQDFDRDFTTCLSCGNWIKRNDIATKCDPKEVRKYKAIIRAKAQEQIVIDRMNARKEKFEMAQRKDELALFQIQQKRRSF